MQIRKTRFVVIALSLMGSVILPGCSGPKVLTDDDKQQLQQVRTIEIDETLDLRTTPNDDDKAWETIESTLAGKIEKAGYSVAGKSEKADAKLSVYVTFVNIRTVGAPLPPIGSQEPAYLHIDLRLTHKSVGRVFTYDTDVPAPYAANYPNDPLIRDLDQILRRKLYKE